MTRKGGKEKGPPSRLHKITFIALNVFSLSLSSTWTWNAWELLILEERTDFLGKILR